MEIDDGDIYVRLMDLPPGIKGFVTESTDMIYNIYINARMSYEMQREAIGHELKHIKESHLYSEKKLVEIE